MRDHALHPAHSPEEIDVNLYMPHRQMAVPPTLHARLEIAKAIDALAAQEADAVVRRRAEISALRRDLEDIPQLLREALAEWRAEMLAELRKYNPDEPRVPKGDPHGGQWTKEEGGEAASGASIDGLNIGGAVSSPLNWLKTKAEDAWSEIQDAIGAAADAEIETQQVRARFGLEHPGVLAGMTATPLLVAALPEALVGGGAFESSEAVESAEGSFSIIDWAEYPVEVPRPTGPFKLLSGSEYNAARAAANTANRALRAADPEAYAGKQIHEIQPVKFGGSPTDLGNKIALISEAHAAVTTWWNRLLRILQ